MSEAAVFDPAALPESDASSYPEPDDDLHARQGTDGRYSYTRKDGRQHGA